MNKHDPQKIETGLQQMQINTRLTALQTALELMKINGYTGIAGQKLSEDPKYTGQLEPVWVKPPGAVDHVTLLAMAGDIENYILGTLVEEAKKAIAEASKPVPVKPHIMRP